MIDSMNLINSGYRISLNDDLRFAIYADKGLKAWLDRLANIMDLAPNSNSSHDHRIFCASMSSNEKEATLQSQDWQIIYDQRIMRLQHRPRTGDYLFEIDNHECREIEYINMWNLLYAVYQPVVHKGGFPLHAGLVEADGKGILIAGRSGQGKSTTCRRLSEYCSVLSDDETLIVSDKRTGYRAHPVPTWSDYLWRCIENKWSMDQSVPLSAIFFIEQSESDEVIPIENQAEAAILINRSASETARKYLPLLQKERRRDEATMIFNNACAMAKAIPAFRLRLTLMGNVQDRIEKSIKL
jgi:SynChlorMet cassette protein ScmC